jgi:hypothetical protein
MNKIRAVIDRPYSVQQFLPARSPLRIYPTALRNLDSAVRLREPLDVNLILSGFLRMECDPAWALLWRKASIASIRAEHHTHRLRSRSDPSVGHYRQNEQDNRFTHTERLIKDEVAVPRPVGRVSRDQRLIHRLFVLEPIHILAKEGSGLVMELVDDTPLKGPLPIEKAAGQARQILDALRCHAPQGHHASRSEASLHSLQPVGREERDGPGIARFPHLAHPAFAHQGTFRRVRYEIRQRLHLFLLANH